MMELPKLTDFSTRDYDKLRYGDTDRQGHVNNAVFTTMFETGRIAVLEAAVGALHLADYNFVIARIAIDYRAELFWPGRVEIGTSVKAIGKSSITLVQALFQNETCVATAESVVVQVDPQTHRPTPLTESQRQVLGALVLAG